MGSGRGSKFRKMVGGIESGRGSKYGENGRGVKMKVVGGLKKW